MTNNMEQSWCEVKVSATFDTEQAITATLLELGATGVSVIDKNAFAEVVNAPDSLDYAGADALSELNDEIVLSAWYDLRDYCEVKSRLAIMLPLIEQAYNLEPGRISYAFEYVAQSEWENEWKKYFNVTHLGDKLVVVPSWLPYEPLQDECVISLDPGSAFGTGQHETTTLVAKALAEQELFDKTVLDVGTGSGILAIFASKLGAKVEAVDIDPMATKVAQANATINEQEIDIHTGTLTEVKQTAYDIILANIVPDVLVPLAQDFASKLKLEGKVILSGILSEHEYRVKDAYAQTTLDLIAVEKAGDWICLTYQKREP